MYDFPLKSVFHESRTTENIADFGFRKKENFIEIIIYLFK
jgi:hypothetical protein